MTADEALEAGTDLTELEAGEWKPEPVDNKPAPASEGDELAEEIAGYRIGEGYYAVDVGYSDAQAIADDILAAGYRKRRTVTTVEELDALPVGTVVILRDAKGLPHPAQKGEEGWRLPFVDAFWTAEKLLAGSESAEVIA